MQIAWKTLSEASNVLAVTVLAAAPLAAADPLPEIGSAYQPQICCCECSEPKTLFCWPNCNRSGDDAGADDTIVTDRPDFTEASSTVGKGRIQVELGYTFSRDDDSGVRVDTHTYPEALFRIGMLAEWFELRIGTTYAHEKTRFGTAPNERLEGLSDLYLGAKLALTEQCGLLPEMAILPQMFVPAGDSDFTDDEVLPGVNLLYSWEINDWLALGANTQVNRVRDDVDNFYAEFTQSASLAVTLTEQWGTYFEYFGLYPAGADAADVGPDHFLNGGFTYLVTNDVQLDWRAGFGLNSGAEDFFTGAGISVRY